MKKLLLTFAFFLIINSHSYAQYSLLHEFAGDGSDGANPNYAQFVQSDTTLYGMTFYGGDYDFGTIFKIETNGSGYSLLHEFGPSDDHCRWPYGSLILSGTTLYGMTSQSYDLLEGAIFKMDTNGSGFSLLHEFEGGDSDGNEPYGSLILLGTTLYGMTRYGGDDNFGTIFKIDTNGSGFLLVHEFAGGGSDGMNPYGSLILSGTTLYGMTFYGGDDNSGTIFKIDTNGSGFALLHEFAGSVSDGMYPYGSLILSGATLYGMTRYGGDYTYGTIFKIDTNGSGFALLHEFAGGGSDGKWPYGSLILSGTALYGMTYQGGDNNKGTIFQIDTNGSGFELFHEFTGGGADGSLPYGSLLLSGAALYGMTLEGGDNNKGVIFSYYLPSTSPTVTTTTITNIGSYTTAGGGNVTDDGGADVTSRGVCWNTSTNPTIANDTTLNGDGTGIFTSNLTGLSAETHYYVKAYAANSGGTGYGSEENFWTYSTEPSAHPASFSAAFASTTSLNLTFSAASTISNCDGYIILRRTDTYPDATNINDGIAAWSLTMPEGTVRCTTVTVTSQTAYENTELTTGQTYYYSIIPFNYNGSNTETFNYKTDGIIKTASATTGSAPTVTTTSVSNITINSASSGGNVTNDGYLSVTARGVCWNTSTNPAIANDTTQNGTGTGEFTSSLTGLTAATHYYLKAYATNAVGTSYGSQTDFYTLSVAPTTQASRIIWLTPSRTSISLQWTNGNGDGRVVLCKYQSAISSNPLSNGTDYTADASFTGSGSSVDGGKIVYKGTGNTVNVTSLVRNRLYYFKVFEYNGSGQTIAYNQSNASGNPNNRMTLRKESIFDEPEQPGEDFSSPSNLEIVRISPNPAQDNLQIEFTNNICRELNISIFTIEGKLINKYNNYKTIGNIAELDLKDLASGQYNLVISCDNELVYGSFVIQK